MLLACGLCGGTVETAAAVSLPFIAWAISEIVVRWHRWRHRDRQK